MRLRVELTVVGDGGDQGLVVDVVAKSLESLVGGCEDGLVASLESAKKRSRVVTNSVCKHGEIVGTEGAKKALGEGGSVAAALGDGASGGSKSDGEGSKELHFELMCEKEKSEREG